MEEEIRNLNIPLEFTQIDFASENALSSMLKCFEDLKEECRILEDKIVFFEKDKSIPLKSEQKMAKINESVEYLKKYHERDHKISLKDLKESNLKRADELMEKANNTRKIPPKNFTPVKPQVNYKINKKKEEVEENLEEYYCQLEKSKIGDLFKSKSQLENKKATPPASIGNTGFKQNLASNKSNSKDNTAAINESSKQSVTKSDSKENIKVIDEPAEVPVPKSENKEDKPASNKPISASLGSENKEDKPTPGNINPAPLQPENKENKSATSKPFSSPFASGNKGNKPSPFKLNLPKLTK